MKYHHCIRLLFLCHRCLIKDFEKRPSVTHLLEHPFIKQVHGKDMSLQKQLAELIQEQQRLGSVAKTRYCTTHMQQLSFLPLILEAKFETLNAQIFTVSNDHMNVLTSNITNSNTSRHTSCMPCECKKHTFPWIAFKATLISHDTNSP